MDFSFGFGFIFLLIILAIISVLPYMNAVYLLDNNKNNEHYKNIALANIIILSIFIFFTIILCFAIFFLNEYLIDTLLIFWIISVLMNNILSLTTAIILVVEYHKEPSKIIPAFIYLSFTCIGILTSIFNPQYYYYYDPDEFDSFFNHHDYNKNNSKIFPQYSNNNNEEFNSFGNLNNHNHNYNKYI
jgi:cytochrome bd-type quinol oxidase subunit 2